MIAKPTFALVSLSLLVAACATVPTGGPTVKVTPLGSHAGELCNRDRAMIFEDPTGVRVLYDAGASVLGGQDPRLGTVHLVLLSHAHGDHMGDQRLTALGAGTCQSPILASAAPNTTTAEIAASKNAGSGDDQPDGELPRQARRGDQEATDGSVPGRGGRRRPHGAVRRELPRGQQPGRHAHVQDGGRDARAWRSRSCRRRTTARSTARS